MPVDHIRYDLLAQEALRSLVRRVLADAAKHGLPGDHHFFIKFNTRASGVKISTRLLSEHHEEMTVVLQHQFWDLVVSEQAFEVGLSFKGVSERLVVPFDAIKGFFDPSVEFGLQFETVTEPAATQAGAPPAPAPAVPTSDLPKAPAPTEEASGSGGAKNDRADPAAGGEVVRLDRFRKK